jgi:hypothetical protein
VQVDVVDCKALPIVSVYLLRRGHSLQHLFVRLPYFVYIIMNARMLTILFCCHTLEILKNHLFQDILHLESLFEFSLHSIELTLVFIART